MPCPVTAFSVKIASPGDAAMEGVIAREVIYEWNALHAWEQKKALLPIQGGCSSTGSQPDSSSDLLVAFFCTSQGAPSSASARDTDLEVERQLKAGRPALIYFSDARSDFVQAGIKEIEVLEQFKQRYPSEAVVDSFGDEKEFRAKFARQLEATLLHHPHFQTGATPAPAPAAVIAETHPPAPKYSKSAQVLLMNACDDPEAYLARMKDSRGLKIQVNGRQFVEPGDPESASMWEAAFNELLAAELIHDVGCNGQLFQISGKGFEFLETLGKYPIGYIAELGGM
jgi:hypothetical protein